MPRYKNLPDFPGYRVGSDGSVWSCKTRKGAPRHTWIVGTQWQRLSQAVVQGYRVVTVTMPTGRRRNVKVHQLVLTMFRGPCPAGMQGCHRNGDKNNNALRNLRWGTPASNYADRDRHGTTVRGERINTAKLTAAAAVRIRQAAANGATKASLSRQYRVTPRAIANIVCGRSWKHAG